jgi:hypothetical protein
MATSTHKNSTTARGVNRRRDVQRRHHSTASAQSAAPSRHLRRGVGSRTRISDSKRAIAVEANAARRHSAETP